MPGRHLAFAAALVCLAILSFFFGAFLRAGFDASPSMDESISPFAVTVREIAEPGREHVLRVRTAADCLSLEAPFGEVCQLALHADPRVISGSALGRLNHERTPAFEALVWRARIDGNVDVCDRGGLEGAYLIECRSAAQAVEFESRGPTTIVMVGRPKGV